MLTQGNWQKIALYISLFFVLGWIDYKNIHDIFRDGKVRYLFFSLSIISFVYLKKHLTWAPALFASMAIVSFTANDFKLFACFPLLVIVATLVMSAIIISQGEDFFANSLIAMGVFQSGVAILQMFGVHYYSVIPYYAEDFYKPVGFIGHPTILGPMLVAAICPALWRGKYLLALLMVGVAIATVSSMTYASLISVLLVYILQRWGFRRVVEVVIFLLIAALVAYSIFPRSNVWQPSGRPYIWMFGWRAFLENPLWGSGIGSWNGIYSPTYKKEILAIFADHTPRQLHNDYLDFLVEFGVLAGAPFVVALLQFLKAFRPSWIHAVCVCILVNAAANFPLCLPPTALVFVVAWAHCFRSVDCTKMPR